jgi:hypothetical protein
MLSLKIEEESSVISYRYIEEMHVPITLIRSMNTTCLRHILVRNGDLSTYMLCVRTFNIPIVDLS